MNDDALNYAAFLLLMALMSMLLGHVLRPYHRKSAEFCKDAAVGFVVVVAMVFGYVVAVGLEQLLMVGGP